MFISNLFTWIFESYNELQCDMGRGIEMAHGTTCKQTALFLYSCLGFLFPYFYIDKEILFGKDWKKIN